MNPIKRRQFFLSPGWLAANAAQTGSANDRLRVGVIGVRGRGRDHMQAFAQASNVQIGAVCDIDQSQAERAQALVEKLGQAKPEAVSDLRKLFEMKNIDAVSIATPNHWHALAAIWACQAGKDVYVEKPVSHNIWEGRKIVEAARKYKRIVQAGMQSRSIAHKKEAIQLLREGGIGRVYMAKGLCFKRRTSIGKSPEGPVPPGVDYNTWLGPAPERPFSPNRFHYNWHWFWDYGNGDIANQGVHEMDIARWGLHQDGLPTKVFSDGGKYVYDDDQETPNTQIATFQYNNLKLVFEVRGLISNSEGSVSFDGANTIGNIFFGSDGYLCVDSKGYQVYLGEKRELVKDVKAKEARIWDSQPHFDNFVAAVRSRKQTDLNADILEGHFSAALCHMANTSYRLGRNLKFDPAKENYGADTEANAMLGRKYRAPFVVPAAV